MLLQFCTDLKAFISCAEKNLKVSVVDLYNEGYLQLFTCKCKSPPNYLLQRLILVSAIFTNFLMHNCLKCLKGGHNSHTLNWKLYVYYFCDILRFILLCKSWVPFRQIDFFSVKYKRMACSEKCSMCIMSVQVQMQVLLHVQVQCVV